MKAFAIVRIFIYIAIFLAILYLPERFFETHSFCIYYNLFGIKCIGCGITRATVSILNGDFYRAWAFNPLAFIAVPLVGFLVLYDSYLTIKKYSNR